MSKRIWRKATNTVIAPTRRQKAAWRRTQQTSKTSPTTTYHITDLQHLDPNSHLLTKKDLHYQRNRPPNNI